MVNEAVPVTEVTLHHSTLAAEAVLANINKSPFTMVVVLTTAIVVTAAANAVPVLILLQAAEEQVRDTTLLQGAVAIFDSAKSIRYSVPLVPKAVITDLPWLMNTVAFFAFPMSCAVDFVLVLAATVCVDNISVAVLMALTATVPAAAVPAPSTTVPINAVPAPIDTVPAVAVPAPKMI